MNFIPIRYKEIVFKNEKKARSYQAQFTKTYGYRPKLFIYPAKGEFKIVKPEGLTVIRRKK